MGGSGTPEPTAKRLADVIGRIRSSRGFSRAKLVIEMCDCLPTDSPLRKTISEGKIRQLEEAKTVKVTRDLLEVLCTALRCTPIERLEIFIAADRNVFANADGTVANGSALLIYALANLQGHPVVGEMLESLATNQNASRMTEQDLNKVLKTIVLSISDLTLEQASTQAIAVNKQL